jgi:acyl-CoA reductase-like NAD-dependent aldehyde dehydrogenase
MNIPLIIGGKEKIQDYFVSVSPFFESYTYRVANANILDVSEAIGYAREADRSTLDTRVNYLKEAGKLFLYDEELLEHTVKLSGMPIRIIKKLFDQIPSIFSEISRAFFERFHVETAGAFCFLEKIGNQYTRLFTPLTGFCYGVTPGNDPRATALVVANLCLLGIPFIIKASKEDAAAYLIIRSLINGGFDPKFCNLLYFDSSADNALEKHFRLVDHASLVWTFGSDSTVDHILRFEQKGRKILIDDEYSGTIDQIALSVSKLTPQKLNQSLKIIDEQVDHFSGKVILRHGSGNCTSIATGQFTKNTEALLFESFVYTIGCNSIRSIMLVNSHEWIYDASKFLESLKVGNPLDFNTEIGYIHPEYLNYLETLLKKYREKVSLLTGKRISPFQATPWLLMCQENEVEFYGQEIPAYLLVASHCGSVREAIDRINANTGKSPRLAVSIWGFEKDNFISNFSELQAHTILVGQPTSKLLPYYHEGNEYFTRLSKSMVRI